MTASNHPNERDEAIGDTPVLAARLRLNPRRSKQREALKDLAWQVADREAFFRSLLETQEDIVWCEGANGSMVYANPAYLRMIGGHADDLVAPRRRDHKIVTDSVRDRRVTRQLEELDTLQGWRWFEVIRHRDSVNEYTQCVGRDVTERVAYQRQIEEARDAANAANRAKSRFLAAMSHEIRTPMNGVLGMAALLAETSLEPEQRTYLNAMDRSGRTLLYLIDEILDFSKIEAGRLELDEQPLVLEDCVQSVIELLTPRAREKGLALAWALDPSLPRTLVGDDVRLRQILTNLIGNAVKFTETGGVLVTIESDRRTSPRGEAGLDRPRLRSQTLVISVLDTGSGIRRDALARLFDEFEQGDEARLNRHGGSGLGLAITRRLARAMGGDVFARSTPGEGSTFTVVLRLRPSIDSGVLQPVRACDRVGYVPHVLLLCASSIERLAVRLTLEGDGVAAVDATLANAGRLIDQAMADEGRFTGLLVDGSISAEAAGALLNRAQRAGPVQGVVLLDPSEREREREYLHQGFQVSLTRPQRPRAFIDALLESPTLADSKAVDPAQLDAAPFVAGSGHLVLLVEDNDINALLATRTLEKLGCHVHAVTNGSAAVLAMDRHLAGEITFSMVLMDVHMPVMDGLEASETIRRRFKAAGRDAHCPPIVALTANAFEEDRKRCLAHGMSGFLAKPFERQALKALLDTVVAGPLPQG